MNLSPLHYAAGLATAFLVHAAASSGPPAVPAQPTEPRTIEVVAKRFEFEPARIEVTEGEPVRLLVHSADGVHGFGIKKMKISEKIPRGGQDVSIEFTPTSTGEFEFHCTEYCGSGHKRMQGTLVVRARDTGLGH